MKNLKQEFEKEFEFITWEDLPFKNLIQANEKFKNALFEEFCKLSPSPKLSLFIQKDISAKEWANECKEVFERKRILDTTIPINTNKFSFFSAIEQKVMNLTAEFYELVRLKKLEKQYFGRFIKDTNTAKILREIRSKMDDFESYVFLNPNVCDFDVYAQSMVKIIIHLSNKVNIPGFKVSLLTHLIDINENPNFVIKKVVNANYQNGDLKLKYKIIKNNFEYILRNEVNKYNQEQPINSEKPLTLSQIALLQSYTNKTINSQNANEIVKSYDLKSGKKLLTWYNALSNRVQRTSAGPIFNVTDQSRAKDISRVIKELEARNLNSNEARAELKILEENIFKAKRDLE